MSAANPFSPPRAVVADVHQEVTEFSTPKVWSAKGRIGRLRYLAYTTVGGLIVGAVAAAAFIAAGPDVGAILGVAIYIPLVVLSFLSLIQRSHDMGWSGWTCLLCFIPFVALIWVFKAGTAGENRFGAPPPPNTTGVKISAFLLFGVALLGIIAAIALPAYQQYTVRAKAAQAAQTP